MHTLIVVAHPDPESLTHGVARALIEGLSETGGHTWEVADLASEGFDPRFARHDVDAYRGKAALSADVLTEQARLDRADGLVLAFPVYWWSMPALLKGWIDRVFVNGWAFAISDEGAVEKRLGRLKVWLVGVGGAESGTYERRGYAEAMGTSIERGVFGYCGARVEGFHLLLESETGDQGANLTRARAIGRGIAEGRGSGPQDVPSDEA